MEGTPLSKRLFALLLSLSLLLGAFAGCSKPDGGIQLDRANPQLLTFCHSYTGRMKQALDTLIADFNDSFGKKNGIAVRAIAVDAEGRDELLEKIIAGAEDAPSMPDLVAVTPAMGARLTQAGLLAALDGRFSAGELEEYVPQFIDSGRMPDGGLYLFPVAQTTEVLFVNRDLFEAFSVASGVAADSLATFEGIGDAAITYYQYTDNQTPDTPDDGRAFFAADSWFDTAFTGVAQMGGTLLGPDGPELRSTEFQRVWQSTVIPGLAGGLRTPETRSFDLYKEERVVCYIAPAADILLYSNYQLAALEILPYPLFEGGNPMAPLTGDGVAVARSTEEKEYAAARFLAWLTAPKQNTRLVTGAGYLPVTAKALEDYTKQTPRDVKDETVRTLLETVAGMYADSPWIEPVYDARTADAADKLEEGLRFVIRDGRRRVLAGDAVPGLNSRLATEFADRGGDMTAQIAAETANAQIAPAMESISPEESTQPQESLLEEPAAEESATAEEESAQSGPDDAAAQPAPEAQQAVPAVP